MSEKRLQTATRIVRNSIVLFAVAAMAKGFGLVIAIVVARYLGAEALGIYAVLMALTMTLEIVAPLGLQDVVVREVAREPATMKRVWLDSAATAFGVGVLMALLVAAVSRVLLVDQTIQLSVDILALGLPLGSVSLVSQAILQGLERLRFLAIATFWARLISLFVLFGLLWAGAGVEAAFVCRLSFHCLTFALLAMAISGYSSKASAPFETIPPFRRLYQRATLALPFAGQRVLGELSLRGSILVLPFLMSMESVGFFDAADRIRQTVAMIIPIVMLAIMPSFSRSFKDDPAQGAELASYSLKFLMIAVLPVALMIAVAPTPIIRLFYGAGYVDSPPVLQLVIWAQVFLSADMIMKQIMIASDNEIAMLKRSALVLILQLVLTVLLAYRFGGLGVAAAIVLASAAALLLDTLFVRKQIVKLELKGAMIKPVLCAFAAALVALPFRDRNEYVVAALAGSAYAIAVLASRAFSSSELLLIRSIPAKLLKRQQ